MGELVLLLTATIATDVGWQPLPDGGLEYIIQFDPQMIEVLRRGQDFISDIPPGLRDIRSYRITVGSDQVPQIDPPPSVIESESPPRPLPPSSVGEHFPERPASWLDEATPPLPPPAATKVEVTDHANNQPTPERTWVEVVLVVGLLASSSAMGYLGWTTWVYRRQYRKVLGQLIEAGREPAVADDV